MGPYILDFYCAPARLAIEVDGAGHGHTDRISHDTHRDAWLREQSVRVLRFQAGDILHRDRLPDVLSTILAVAVAAPSTAFGGPPPPLRGGGS